MAPFFFRFSRVRFAQIKKSFRQTQERDVIFRAALAVTTLLIALLVLDGYFFFVAAKREYAPPADARVGTPLSDEQIDEVIRILDERAAKFRGIMEADAGATNTEK